MKKITIYIVMAVLCLNFTAKAQSNKAVDVTLKGIQIGQVVPDITITGLHNYKDPSGKPATTAKLSDFKGKLLILDFWATWCSPCIAMIPKMDSLQKAFGDKIQFLSVTYQTQKEVLPFLEKLEKQDGKHYNLPVVTASKQLHQLFPHVSLPHYVWIDGDGKVMAFTRYDEVNFSAINMVLQGGGSLKRKTDFKVSYDIKRPLFINGNGGSGENMIYHSLLSGFSQGLSAGTSYEKLDTTGNSTRRISCWNTSMVNLFRAAYQEDKRHISKNNTLILVKDSLKIAGPLGTGSPVTEWRKSSSYCYELMVPPAQAANAFGIMRQELEKLFSDYKVGMEKLKRNCLVLVRTSDIDKLKTRGGKPYGNVDQYRFQVENADLGYLITRLELTYMSKQALPIVDGTGYLEKVDLDIEANLSNLVQLNNALMRYDLAFVEKEMEIDVLVFRDKQKVYEN